MRSAILVTKADGTQHVVGPFESDRDAEIHIDDTPWPASFRLEVLDIVEPDNG